MEKTNFIGPCTLNFTVIDYFGLFAVYN